MIYLCSLFRIIYLACVRAIVALKLKLVEQASSGCMVWSTCIQAYLVTVFRTVLDFLMSFSYLCLAWFNFSDGKTVGACLDRNGLRPARYWRTIDNVVYVASEVCFLHPWHFILRDIKLLWEIKAWIVNFTTWLKPWRHLTSLSNVKSVEFYCWWLR